MSLDQYSKEELQETALIEAAFELLQEKKQPYGFQELVDELKKIMGISDEQAKEQVVQFYTDLNLDGRFLVLGENRWGLRVWYPVDQAEEDVITPVKPRKKKAKKKKVVEDDFDDIEDEDDFDDFDEVEEDDILDDDEDIDADFDDEDDEDDDDLVEDEDELELDEDLDEDEEFEEELDDDK